VGQNQKLRARLASVEWRIEQHNRKIAIERRKAMPDAGLISHWEAEISKWENQRARLLRRLGRDWRG
jgi:hypothetical protein